MPFIQENLIEINLGLKKNYKLLHISDCHAVTYKESDKEEAILEAKKAEELWLKQRTWFADKANEYYDDSHMIESKKCLNNLITYINKEKPTGVVLSGDIIDYYSESNYDMLVDACGALNYPFVFACGNHETPVNRYTDLTFSDIGFTVLDFDEFKLISLDNSTKKVTKETLESLKEELEDDEPIIIAMHIPILTETNKEKLKIYDPYFFIDENNTDECTKEFIDILKNNDKIKAILSGHVHAKCESYFTDDKMQYCASSGLIGFINKIILK